jgi:hypothetical protein
MLKKIGPYVPLLFKQLSSFCSLRHICNEIEHSLNVAYLQKLVDSKQMPNFTCLEIETTIYNFGC